MNKKKMVNTAEFRALLSEFNDQVPRYMNEFKFTNVDDAITQFAKEVTEDDWEILEFKHKLGFGAYLNSAGSYNGSSGAAMTYSSGSSLKDLLCNVPTGIWRIVKVRIKSTGIIFEIGDTVVCANEKSHLHKLESEITSFGLNKEGNVVVHTTKTNENGLFVGNITKVEKPKFSFTTLDGKVIADPIHPVYRLSDAGTVISVPAETGRKFGREYTYYSSKEALIDAEVQKLKKRLGA